MQRFTALLLLVLCALSSLSFAQEKSDKATLNQKAIDALQAKKFDEGIAFLMRILDQEPKDTGTAYNLACAYSLKGDVEKGLEWLGTAVDWGWGSGTGTLVSNSQKPLSHIEMTKTDPDFANLRKDPRFDKLVERMENAAELGKAKLKKGEEYAATPAIYIPEKVAALKEMPILVVLHDAGSTKDEVVKGRWKEIADELGFALIAPSGKIPVGEDPAKGMTWFDSPADYTARAFAFEKPVNDAVSAFKKDHPIDKAQVVVAGEGLGGLVALDVAINGPGLYKGAVTLNSGFAPDLYAAKAPSAGKMGLRVALLVDSSKVPKEAVADGGLQKLVEAQNKSLQTWGLAGETRSYTPDPKDAGDKKLLVEAIRSVLTRTAATPASAPTEPKK